MFHPNRPKNEDLPTHEELKSSLKKAFYSSLVILFIAVLPAEYGIDITGIGGVLGLKKMGEIKQSLEEEASSDKTVNNGDSTTQKVMVADNTTTTSKKEVQGSMSTKNSSDSISVTLSPNQGAELKVEANEGNKISYSWKTEGGPLNYNVHGESFVGGDSYEYTKGNGKESNEGTIIAEFDGTHGWFFRNRQSDSVTVTIQVNGEFSNLKRVD